MFDEIYPRRNPHLLIIGELSRIINSVSCNYLFQTDK